MLKCCLMLCGHWRIKMRDWTKAEINRHMAKLNSRRKKRGERLLRKTSSRDRTFVAHDLDYLDAKKHRQGKKYGTTKEDYKQFVKAYSHLGWSKTRIQSAWESHKAKHRNRTPRKRNTSHYGNPSQDTLNATTLLLLGAALFGMKQAKDKGLY